MAKTIKEMLQESAYKAYPEELDNKTEHSVSMRVGYKIGFEAGANAALILLEKFINTFKEYEETKCIGWFMEVDVLLSKIKELKGE